MGKYPGQRWVDSPKDGKKGSSYQGQTTEPSWKKSSISDLKKRAAKEPKGRVKEKGWKTVAKFDDVNRSSAEEEKEWRQHFNPLKEYKIHDRGITVESDRYELQEKM